MCYVLYLSTDGSQDLSAYNSDLVGFERLGVVEDEYASFLRYPCNWFVGSPKGCSCDFRHLAGGDLDFDEPQDWCPEHEDNIRATIELYRVIAGLVSAGYEVECLDAWNGASRDEITSMHVDLANVSEEAFCLFENYHFVFGCGTQRLL